MLPEMNGKFYGELRGLLYKILSLFAFRKAFCLYIKYMIGKCRKTNLTAGI